MDNLNSILIEGNLKEDPVNDEEALCFTIITNRYYKKNDEQKKESLNIPIEAFESLAINCNTYLKKGRGVRVVGRISQNSTNNLIVIAEHVEFKPELKENKQ